MASFLKLLAQTLFGYEFKSLELNQLHPPGKGSLGEGDLFWGEGVMAILSKYANFPLLYRGVCKQNINWVLIFSTCIGSRKYLQLSMSVLLGRGSAIVVIRLENQNFIGKLNLECLFLEYILEFEPDIFNMTFQI